MRSYWGARTARYVGTGSCREGGVGGSREGEQRLSQRAASCERLMHGVAFPIDIPTINLKHVVYGSQDAVTGFCGSSSGEQWPEHPEMDQVIPPPAIGSSTKNAVSAPGAPVSRRIPGQKKPPRNSFPRLLQKKQRKRIPGRFGPLPAERRAKRAAERAAAERAAAERAAAQEHGAGGAAAAERAAAHHGSGIVAEKKFG